MVAARGLSALSVVVCVYGTACAAQAVDREPTAQAQAAPDRTDPGDLTASAEPSGNRAAPTSLPPSGSVSSEPHPPDLGFPSLLIGADESTIDACSSRTPEQDRVALHHRDDASGTCMDLILVRVGQGGVAPEHLALPLDWGVGHMSAYTCAPDGTLLEDASPTPMSTVSGNIGMGGNMTALPASLFLDVSMTAASSSGTDAGSVYNWHTRQGLDVTASCDSSMPWASQPLNLHAEPPSIQTTGCTYIGGYNRVTIQQRDSATSICTELRLIQSFGEEGNGTVPPGLSLPESWAVEDMYSFFCWPVNASRPVQVHYDNHFTAAVGNVTFASGNGGWPQSVSLDVSLSAPDYETQGEVREDLRIDRQRLVSTDSIDVRGDACNLW